jgi:PatG C-terminal
MRKDVREFIRRLEAAGLTVESTPGHFRVLRDGKALVGVDARSDIAADRRVVAVRLVFREARSHLVERYHCTVDVTDMFPFLTSSLSQTFD